MNEDDRESARQLRSRIQSFLRVFGALEEHETPCGEPLSVSHAHALMILRDTDSGIRISDLGAELRVDKSNVSRLCVRMEEEEHVERRPCPEDGRAKRLHLTEEGAKLAERVEASSLRRFRRILDALPDARRDDLLLAFDALNTVLRREFNEG